VSRKAQGAAVAVAVAVGAAERGASEEFEEAVVPDCSA